MPRLVNFYRLYLSSRAGALHDDFRDQYATKLLIVFLGHVTIGAIDVLCIYLAVVYGQKSAYH